MITDDELDEIQARANAATEGPWEPDVDGSMGWIITHHSLDGRENREPSG